MEEERISVLYIDDEQSNLNNFKANFRLDYHVVLANSASQAFEILEGQKFHIIIADQKMPGMTGVEFFEAIIETYKAPIRILITGYTDIEAAIDSINKGKVFRYIKKPWDEQEIRMAIQNGYEIYHAKETLHQKNQELQKINEELNRFVYSASHDLKAPILSIKGLLNVARLEGNEKDSDKFFNLISKGVKQLEVFIENIISYYKNIRVQNNFSVIDFKKIIYETIDSYQSYYYSPIIKFDILVDTNEEFISDEFRIRVILNNILSNAIKYQRPEEENKMVNIAVTVANKLATIIIEDNGIGIEEQYITDIYKMFFRATEQNTGSGIGLYIVKEAVVKVNGEIELESKENQGSKFIIKIPSREKYETLISDVNSLERAERFRNNNL